MPKTTQANHPTRNLYTPRTYRLINNKCRLAKKGRSGTGMAVTVEIKAGSRRIISYLLSPLMKVKQNALRER